MDAAPTVTNDPVAAPAALATNTEAPAAAIIPDAAVASPAGALPADWASTRDRYAKGDTRLLAQLSRYSSVDSVIDAMRAAQNKISSVGLKEALAENPTPEQLTEWRTLNGVPTSVEGYQTKIPPGLTLTDEGQATVAGLLKAAHGANLTEKQVGTTLEYLWSAQEARAASAKARDQETLSSATATMSAEWGPEFKLNQNLIKNIMSRGSAELQESLLGARLQDGTPLWNSPAALRWMADIAREIDPTPTLTPGGGVATIESVDTEMNTMRTLMGDHNSKYWKGPESRGLQERFLKLSDKRRVLSR